MEVLWYQKGVLYKIQSVVPLTLFFATHSPLYFQALMCYLIDMDEQYKKILFCTDFSERAYIEMRIGDPARAILEYAEAEGVDLIVMGRQGHQPITHWLLGNVASKTARKTPCPVLIVAIEAKKNSSSVTCRSSSRLRNPFLSRAQHLQCAHRSVQADRCRAPPSSAYPA